MLKNLKIYTLGLLIFVAPIALFGQGLQKKVVLNWKGVQTIQGINDESLKALCADGLSNNASKSYTPEYREKFKLPANAGSCDILVTHTEWESVSNELMSSLTYSLQPDETLSPKIETGTERGMDMVMLTIVPVVVNPEGGIMRLKSFTIDMVYVPSRSKETTFKSTNYASHSVLAHGNWYKIQLNKTGIYKVTYSEIQAMGVDMAAVTPNSIRLFGNGGGLLPEANNASRYDDLTENAIRVVTANQGVFTSGDYILFYGTGPGKITYNKTSRKFEHTLNIYSDYTYYFLNFDGGVGLRIEDQEQPSLTPTYTCTSFTEGVFYEKDILNGISSGKDWLGERMDAGSNIFELPEFTFPNVSTGKQSSIRYRVAAQATVKTDFAVNVNGVQVGLPWCYQIGIYDFAIERIETKAFSTSTDKVKVSFQYNGGGSSLGYLDWVELNVPRDLKFTGGQMAFADPSSILTGAVTEFQLQASTSNVVVWEVTNPLKVKRVVTSLQGDISKFILHTDSLRQFVAWDNSSFLTTKYTEKVVNQDLHGIASTDMLIVTNKDFLDQANRLAEHHRTFDGFNVTVATNEQIYNEFSSGAPDIVAIRDFARLLYEKPEAGHKLRYLLLFGDGSYDYKDHIPANTNRVLTFQTKQSLNYVYSYASDDFYGLLDAAEGDNAVGFMDIGIGRFPVNTFDQATNAVDKCLFYATNSEASMGDWRNKLLFVADNGNSNTHFSQVEYSITPVVSKIAPVFNINKAYIDAFMQVATPSGQRCPDVNSVINTNIENGVLLINYTGHGGETGWAEEGILTIREINAWTNFTHMPVFMTATCEFSRYDDPVRVSAGEQVFLNPVGGGIALFTTTRLANSQTNKDLTIYFYDTLFAKNNGEYPRFGDVIAYAKNMMGNGEASLIRNFVLLGDPALKLAYPKYNVITTEINGHDVSKYLDTISAMKPVEIKGMVADASGNKLTGFTGIIDVKVFDKPRTLMTLGGIINDYPAPYKLQDNYIYQGRATVTNGDFTIKFIAPRDIDYSFGLGKISYYAHNESIDANGYSQQFVIGGSGNESADNLGPLISLFMDSQDFVEGGITGSTPTLLAHLSDQSGINTISNAIGHDIVATIDGDNSTAIVLNSYYSADLDSYSSGQVAYKLSQLTEGIHTLTLKAWDVFNNSSESTISFTVDKNLQISITNMNVYPNPFREEVKVDFETNLFDTQIEAYLEIFNINGSMVASTESKVFLSQGNYASQITWNGHNASGSIVPPGVYLISVRAGDGKSETVKASRLIKVK
ncbi:MAG: type IX secretion system sortase PorU [Bacteroidales bacterium]|nr:type IX secretion system sortase PorU [Bacteroidales bacterium]